MVLKIGKFIGKGIALIVVIALVLVGGFFGLATATEYTPGDEESIEVARPREDARRREIAPGDSLKLMTFNIGYAGLGRDQTFFMDGGTMVRPDSQADVETNFDGITEILHAARADIYFIQEVDTSSKRSYGIDQVEALSNEIGANATFARNFKTFYNPIPLTDAIGKVDSGLLSLTDLDVRSATRIALPVPFTWPVRVFNLKRCLLVERVPVEGGGELVLINLHLEAYDDGEGKAAQLKALMDYVAEERRAGNYVIVGGDFNHDLPGFSYPTVSTAWTPGVLEPDILPDGFSFAVDPTVPTSTLNDHPYTGDPATTQLYGIDGFIVSDNVNVTAVHGVDAGFEFSDHNPVILEVTLKR